MNLLSAWVREASGAVLLEQAALKADGRTECPLILAAVFAEDGKAAWEAKRRLGTWFQTGFAERIRRLGGTETRLDALGEAFAEADHILRELREELGRCLPCAGVLGAGEELIAFARAGEGDGRDAMAVYRLASAFGRRRLLPCLGGSLDAAGSKEDMRSAMFRAEGGTMLLACPERWMSELGAPSVADCLGGTARTEGAMERAARELAESAGGAAVVLAYQEPV